MPCLEMGDSDAVGQGQSLHHWGFPRSAGDLLCHTALTCSAQDLNSGMVLVSRVGGK